MPHPESPIQDPYLGRESLFLFDSLITGAMEVNTKVADWTHGRQLTRLQRAACQIIPNSFSLALSIRELIRCGYLFSAHILCRPLLERVAVVNYLMHDSGAALNLWERGWPHKSRPPLSAMLRAISEHAEFDELHQSDLTDVVQEMVHGFNSIIHADPAGLDTNIGLTTNGQFGYLSGANLNDPERCDHICYQAVAYLSLLIKRAAAIFPEVQLGHPDRRSAGQPLH